MVTSRKYRSREGTTLLEVMVAIAIASIALVSFITLVITSMNLEDHARKVTDATLAADDKLKEVERTGFPDVGKTDGLIDEQDPDGFSYVMVVTETSIDQVRQIDIEVFWENKKRSVTLTTFIAKQ
jgi:general secretion pathway protein I